MGLCTFKGGVHPYDGKDLSKDKPIQEYLPKGDLVYPLSQHIGAPAKPVVAVGDAVLKGQMIAEAGGFVSAPIYATVSGTVKAIEPRRVAVGDMVNSIVVENDGEFKSLEFEQRRDHQEDSECRYRRYGWCGIPDTCKTLTEGTGKNRLHYCKLCRM